MSSGVAGPNAPEARQQNYAARRQEIPAKRAFPETSPHNNYVRISALLERALHPKRLAGRSLIP
jgi:hypothetical protein